MHFRTHPSNKSAGFAYVPLCSSDLPTRVIDILQFKTKFVPDEDGDWEVGLNLAGVGNLFLDQKLIVDLSTNPEQGKTFFDLGTVDVQTIVKGLKAGQEYELEVQINNAEFVARGPPFFCWGGFRLGAFRVVDPEAAIQEAVDLVKESDGRSSRTFSAQANSDYLSSCHRSCWFESRVSSRPTLQLCPCLTYFRWESEGFDRPDLE